MGLVEEAEAMADHLGQVPFAHEVRMDGETFRKAVSIIRRMVAELRDTQEEVSRLEGDVEGWQFAAQYPRD